MTIRYGDDKLQKPCKRCGRYFVPATRYSHLCQNCKDLAMKKRDENKRKLLQNRKV